MTAPALPQGRFTVARCGSCGSAYLRGPDAPIEQHAKEVLAADLQGAPADCWRVFETLFDPARTLTSAKELAEALGMRVNTLNSRFFRAGLPSPKRYVLYAMLVRACGAAQRLGRRATSARIAYTVGASSPQAFNRTIREQLGLTAQEMTSRYTGPAMLDLFRLRLIQPYLGKLKTFAPLAD